MHTEDVARARAVETILTRYRSFPLQSKPTRDLGALLDSEIAGADFPLTDRVGQFLRASRSTRDSVRAPPRRAVGRSRQVEIGLPSHPGSRISAPTYSCTDRWLYEPDRCSSASITRATTIGRKTARSAPRFARARKPWGKWMVSVALTRGDARMRLCGPRKPFRHRPSKNSYGKPANLCASVNPIA